ncbi:hypothetical protein AHF37_06701 [Paragonimus kellicotti]|nr:hypothetical protein AHF37_06701 [Paragonimus kellicotti]
MVEKTNTVRRDLETFATILGVEFSERTYLSLTTLQFRLLLSLSCESSYVLKHLSERAGIPTSTPCTRIYDSRRALVSRSPVLSFCINIRLLACRFHVSTGDLFTHYVILNRSSRFT